MTIDDLVQQIEETERLIVVYRNADEVVVGTQDQIYTRRGLINRTIFTAAEIGDQIVNSSSGGLRRCGHSSKNSMAKASGKADSLPCRLDGRGRRCVQHHSERPRGVNRIRCQSA